ncbi:MAG: phenol hydrolase gamma subunit [Rhodocyclaceae bacterium]|nr:phenol hydrolase gamma subunit [Rhodocyclaceae bacterium]
MTVNALYPDYQGKVRDAESNFHGGRLLYVAWNRHLMFTNPFAYLVQPDMKFGDFVKTVMAPSFETHPDWAKIDWTKVTWHRKGESFAPDCSKTLKENGLAHKAAIQFSTPGLDGIGGLGI